MQQEIISTTQLRENFPAIAAKLMQGKEFLLLRRSTPLAILKPLATKAPQEKKCSMAQMLASPKKKWLIHTKKSAVQLVREERNE
ncbi:hypothetical protein B5M47_03150 [candidate division CPR3 bacterium 4484_211]|uniref:Antitoxin n=1 Tax=candidate division CPR3 bacterium 4484_211 TaxID=1968527 RepID=A0A1W9NXG7_UNCC3|nr:MAG: hypothetical protein B5M47_03150 [candidate division CPR3 bacterium 4484_211]